ncbi:hypothetical protein VP06_10505 [Methylobacterium aquaticum]|uniref:Uncharacterized protein n=1 Tax=Methylobacterium aquaticum TaxID=270351 RepID=A0A0J6SRK3_9HYPH|nr:hypothetical protein VP06_10505 [Methylobacterium aquaticum]
MCLGAFGFCCHVEDAGEIAVQVDQQSFRLRVRRQDDAVDQRSNQFGCFIAPRLVVQRIDERCHLRPVAERHVRMEEDRRRLLAS